MEFLWVNYLLGVSNVVGILALISFIEHNSIYWVTNASITMGIIIASALMHLSETKHQLIGVFPYNSYSNEFLWLDRFLAIGGCIWFSYYLLIIWTPPMIFWYEALFGLVLVIISEQMKSHYFIIPHIIWHFIIYHLLWRIANKI